MTAPTSPAAGKDTETPSVAAGQVVHFTFTDPILGGQLDGLGIVVGVREDGDGTVVGVAPVAGYVVTVPAADVQLAQLPAEPDEAGS